MSYTFGSLFTGIGGIDLGLERAGWTGRWQVEWDPFCQHVLAHHWPDVPRYGDITRVDWSTVEPVDLIAGGFPCQPWSVAGKQQGTNDDRWLWPEFERAVRELRPRYVLVENVPGLLVGRGGMGAVLGGLAALGYDAQWDCIPAASVGAPHLRDRVWIVADRAELGRPLADADDGRSFHQVRAGRDAARDGGSDVADAKRGHGSALDQGCLLAEPGRERPTARLADGYLSGDRQWGTEPNVGRVAHGVPARVDRLRALGNAVVPQIPEIIGRRLIEMSQERAA